MSSSLIKMGFREFDGISGFTAPPFCLVLFCSTLSIVITENCIGVELYRKKENSGLIELYDENHWWSASFTAGVCILRPEASLGHERVEINRDATFELTSCATDYFVPCNRLDVYLLTYGGIFERKIEIRIVSHVSDIFCLSLIQRLITKLLMCL